VLGQSVSIALNHGRYFDLVQDAVDDHASVLGMALMGEDGLLPTVVLCQMEDDDYHVDAGVRGRITVSVTLTGVGGSVPSGPIGADET
jgi:hypothetical protein